MRLHHISSYCLILILAVAQSGIKASEKPVKVFIMMGQSNMIGFGRIDPVDTPGTLAHMTQVQNSDLHLLTNEGK